MRWCWMGVRWREHQEMMPECWNTENMRPFTECLLKQMYHIIIFMCLEISSTYLKKWSIPFFFKSMPKQIFRLRLIITGSELDSPNWNYNSSSIQWSHTAKWVDSLHVWAKDHRMSTVLWYKEKAQGWRKFLTHTFLDAGKNFYRRKFLCYFLWNMAISWDHQNFYKNRNAIWSLIFLGMLLQI